MARTNPNSIRQRLQNLQPGATARFPIEKMRPIRTAVYELNRMFKLGLTTVTTPSLITVTRLREPQKEE